MFETRIDPREIVVADRLRAVDGDIVAAIRAVGLKDELHPIIVRPVGDALHLVAGAHRLAAALAEGRAEIAAIVQSLDDDAARLVEIEENMVRKGLKGLERARFLAEWKRIYEARNPETRKGAHGHNKGRLENGIFPFSRLAARKLGCDRSTVEKSVALFSRLTDAVRRRIAGTWIADKDSELRALAKLEPERQAAAVAAMLRAEAPAASVRKALAEIDGEEGAPADERQFARLAAAWEGAGAAARARFAAMLREAGYLEG